MPPAIFSIRFLFNELQNIQRAVENLVRSELCCSFFAHCNGRVLFYSQRPVYIEVVSGLQQMNMR